MSLAREQRIAVTAKARGGDLSGVGPEDYFVLSRIEGKASVGDVIAAAGMPASDVQAILTRLIDAGAIETIEGAAPAKPRVRSPTSPGLRTSVAERRRKALAQGLKKPAAHETPTREMRSINDPTRETRETPAVVEPQAFALDPVQADDPRLDPDLALEVPEQRALLAMVDRGDDLTPFETLGLLPTDDLSAIRKAFHASSRRFHPDAYHGRVLGNFASHLNVLFAAAKDAYKQLNNEEVRRPYVETYEAKRDAAREVVERKERQKQAAAAAAKEIRDRRGQQEVDARRQARVRDRAQAQRGRVLANLAGRVRRHVEDAEKAERAGNLAAAANHYRLALRIDPNMADVKEKWQKARTAARKERAKEAFSRANSYLDVGQSAEALPLLIEAADADPTPEHLANAAEHLRSTDKGKARELAMGALNALNALDQDDGEAPGKKRSPEKIAALRLMIGRAFIDAGQKETARAQAELAKRVLPDSPEVRALLNSAKKK